MLQTRHPLLAESPGTFRARTGLRAAQLLAVLAVCAGLRIWVIAHTEVIAEDGITYVAMARDWSSHPMEVIRNNDYHVGYPVAIVGMRSVLAALGLAQGPGAWDLAGQMVSLLAATAAMAAVWVFAGLAFNGRIAWMAVLVFGLGRKWADLGADVLSDALAVCLQIWAVLLAWFVARHLRQRSRWAVVLAACTGIVVGLGYLVRPEALLVTAIAVLLWLACQVRRRGSWALTLVSAAVAVATTIACAAPYMIAIGGLTKKKSLSDIVAVPLQHGGAAVLAAAGAGSWLDAARELANKFFEAQHPAAATLLCIWLSAWIGKRILRLPLPRAVLIFPNRIGALLMAAASALILPMLAGLYVHVHYLSHRHLMLLAAMLSPLAAAGGLIVVTWLQIAAKRFHLPRWAGRVILPAGAAAMVLGLLWHSVEPLHAGREHYRQAGQFVAQAADAAGSNQHVLADNRWCVHYASAADAQRVSLLPTKGLGAEALLGEVRRTSAAWVVLGDDAIAHAGGSLAATLRPPAFIEVKSFPPRLGGTGEVLHVYRVQPPALPPLP